jgi:hypothetical protein
MRYLPKFNARLTHRYNCGHFAIVSIRERIDCSTHCRLRYCRQVEEIQTGPSVEAAKPDQ